MLSGALKSGQAVGLLYKRSRLAKGSPELPPFRFDAPWHSTATLPTASLPRPLFVPIRLLRGGLPSALELLQELTAELVQCFGVESMPQTFLFAHPPHEVSDYHLFRHMNQNLTISTETTPVQGRQWCRTGWRSSRKRITPLRVLHVMVQDDDDAVNTVHKPV